MYRTLVGEAGFRKGMDLYFKRHDGQAVSCDDFRAAMADANNIDLDQFERWYLQVCCSFVCWCVLGVFFVEWACGARPYGGCGLLCNVDVLPSSF